MVDQNLIRKEFAALKEDIYLNAAYMGPYPQRTQQAVAEVVSRYANPSNMDYSWTLYPDEVRHSLSRLLNVKAEQFSLNSSTGEAVSFFALGCQLPPGSRVALFHNEYPSDVLPWLFAQKQRRDFEIDFYDKNILFDITELQNRLHPKTRILNISQVGFQTGLRVDLKSIGTFLREREIMFVADVTQGLGGVAISAEEIELTDLMVCSPYKWLLSPYGQAFAWWSERALACVEQTQGNWLTQPQSPHKLTEYTLLAKPGARKFDRGHAPNPLGAKGLLASLTLFQEIGLENIEKHNLKMAQFFLEHFNKNKYELVAASPLPSAIVTLKSKSLSSDELQIKLSEAKIDVSVREGNLRVSFHLFNSLDHVEAILKTLG